jgi:hypothetical protein
MADIREAGARIRLMAMATFPPASPPRSPVPEYMP